MNSNFYGVDTAGIPKIEEAITAYIKKIQAQNLGVTTSVAKAYAQGSASANAIVSGLNLIEKTIDSQIASKLNAFSTRAKEQMSAYSKFDSQSGTQLNSDFKKANNSISTSIQKS